MGGLRAALYKDARLFLGGAGLFSLFLPLVLLAALSLGMGDLAAGAGVQPFPIAVCDLDQNVLTATLVSQISQVELFSEVAELESEDQAQDALEDGAAAVVIIPDGFFYNIYRMREAPVRVLLNDDLELEGALFRSILTSVLDILRADQAAARGVYRFAYGELTEELAGEMYSEAALRLANDALGRYVDTFDGGAQVSDLAGALERRLTACVLGALTFFFALAAVRTVPEELALGVLPRFAAAGGRVWAFLLSKLLAAQLLSLPSLLLLGLWAGRETLLGLILLSLWLTFGAFGLLLAVAAWAPDPAAAQRRGNLLLLLSLVAGGALWPVSWMPAPLAAAGRLALPRYALLGVEGLARGLTAGELAALLWPVGAMGLGGLGLALPRLRRVPRTGGRPRASAPQDHPPLPPSEPRTGILSRLFSLTALKAWALAGRWGGIAALLALALVCGGAARAAREGEAGALSVAVCDLDGSSLSAALIDALEDTDGLSVTSAGSREEGRALLLSGGVEGLLTIKPDYAQNLAGGEDPPLRYESAASSLSGQSAQEIIAGQTAVQRSLLRASEDAARHLGRTLTGAEEEALLSLIAAETAQAPALCTVEGEEGGSVSSPFLPNAMALAALAVLVTLLTAGAWCGGADSRRVAARMASLPRGRLLALGSDCLSLALVGLGLGAAILLLSGGWEVFSLPALTAYSLCVSALALAITAHTAAEGRMDGLAPFLALILCLLGGCFMDLSQLSPAMEALSLASPAGLALRAGQGELWAAAVLLGEGALLLAAACRRYGRL